MGTGTDPTLEISGTTCTGATIKTAGALTAITGVTGLTITGGSSGASNGRCSVTMKVVSVAVSAAGTNYTAPPTVDVAATGLVQPAIEATMVGRSATITNSSAIGTAAGTITVTA